MPPVGRQAMIRQAWTTTGFAGNHPKACQPSMTTQNTPSTISGWSSIFTVTAAAMRFRLALRSVPKRLAPTKNSASPPALPASRDTARSNGPGTETGSPAKASPSNVATTIGLRATPPSTRSRRSAGGADQPASPRAVPG